MYRESRGMPRDRARRCPQLASAAPAGQTGRRWHTAKNREGRSRRVKPTVASPTPVASATTIVIERTGCFAIRRSARRTFDAVIQRVMRTSLKYHRGTLTDFTEIPLPQSSAPVRHGDEGWTGDLVLEGGILNCTRKRW